MSPAARYAERSARATQQRDVLREDLAEDLKAGRLEGLNQRLAAIASLDVDATLWQLAADEGLDRAARVAAMRIHHLIDGVAGNQRDLRADASAARSWLAEVVDELPDPAIVIRILGGGIFAAMRQPRYPDQERPAPSP